MVTTARLNYLSLNLGITLTLFFCCLTKTNIRLELDYKFGGTVTKKVGIYEAKTPLARWVEKVAESKSLIITRHGKYSPQSQ